ncbi:MAG: hypothetical protein A2014_07195 [Spirochaetes bacterium GWF1_49_6]|nr:MAG: hypothetical protein A2014_07195 [Spirochaetes bacterium GWF1_49_6]
MKKKILISGIIFLFSAILITGCGGGGAAAKGEVSSLESGTYKKGNNIMFVYKTSQPDIKSVAVTGDFSQWKKDGIPMTYEKGIWKVVLSLADGIYAYKLVINGTVMMTPPGAEAIAPDGFGGKNGVFEISGSSE